MADSPAAREIRTFAGSLDFRNLMVSSLRLTRATNSNQRATSGVGLPGTMSDPCRRSISVLYDQTTVPCNNNLHLSHSNNLVQQFVQHLASLISGKMEESTLNETKYLHGGNRSFLS